MRPHSILNLILWIGLTIGTVPFGAGAASHLSASASGERFLFVVDKSSGMERLQDATEATIFDLIGSGIYGQMQAGDTFGLWTFNKETSAGKFSMQVWDPRKARQQATVVAAFLSGVEYEGSSNLKDVTEKLKKIIHSVSNVTVFVISDGDSQMKGTPFDKTINAEYKNQRKQRASAKRPFVTTLIARDGWIIDQSVTVAGTRIDLPPRPALTEPPPPALATTAKSNPIVSSPIVQAPAPAAAQTAPPIPKPAPKISIVTKKPAETTETNTTAQVLTVAAANAAPVPAIEPATTAQVTAPAPAPAAVPNPNSTPDAEPSRTEIASQDSILAAANKLVTAPSPTAPAAAATRTEKSASETSPSTAIPVSSSTIESVFSQLTPEPTRVAARETSTGSNTSSPETTAALQGVGTPIATSGSHVWQIVFGALLLVAALFLGFTVIRQRRPATHASLITQSMERR